MGELDLFWMRRKMALVSQEPVLFATTISGNIAYGREATQEEVSRLSCNFDWMRFSLMFYSAFLA